MVIKRPKQKREEAALEKRDDFQGKKQTKKQLAIGITDKDTVDKNVNITPANNTANDSTVNNNNINATEHVNDTDITIAAHSWSDRLESVTVM